MADISIKSLRPSAPQPDLVARRPRRLVEPTRGLAADRRQFPDLPDPADDAVAEPEPARSARHQPVHPAAGAVRRRRAAAEDERPALDAGQPAADRAVDPGAGLRRQDRRVDGSTTALTNSSAIWTAQHAERRQRPRHHHQFAPDKPCSPATTPSTPATSCSVERQGQ